MNKINDTEKKQVSDILLMPICCDKKYIGVKREDNKILTTQKYVGNIDADMSDFAIGFYKIIYRDILNSNCILTEEGKLMNYEFAGDTMNSFNIIANRTTGAGKSRKSRTPEEEWPEYLRKYKEQYHCLANFWLLPCEIGRTFKGILNKLAKARDYMDIFLEKVKTTIDFTNNREYYEKFKNWELFAEKHFLTNSYINKTLEVEMYSNNSSETFVENAINKMYLRAKCISESNIASELWKYFKDYNLFD